MIGFGVILISAILLGYSIGLFVRHRGKRNLLLVGSFVALFLSGVFQESEVLTSTYGLQVNIATRRLLELGGLVFFGLFAICIVLAMRQMTSVLPSSPPPPPAQEEKK